LKTVAGETIVSNLGKKRLDAVWAIATYASTGGVMSAVPFPGTELPKQIALTASDILLYTTIWKIYFGEELSRKQLLEMLSELGLITVAAAGTAYVVTKGSTALLTEITNRFGPVGWGVAATITGSATGLFGAAWIWYCEHLYSEKKLSI
jgi:hypothetical protein